jgi:Homeodomain-like domain
MEAASDFAPLAWRVVDQLPWRSELIRPLVLFENGPATQRAQATHTHPDTVRKLRRRCQRQGMLGLLRDGVEVVPQAPPPRVSEAVIEAIDRRTALDAGFHARELARIVFSKRGERIDHKTAQRLWQQRPVVSQESLPLGDYHTRPDRYQARWQVSKLYAHGWEKISISRVLHVSRPTVAAWIKRFATEHDAGLLARSRAPKAPARQVWLPLMMEGYHLPKRHPDAGKVRLWSLLAHPDIAVRTVAHMMALNKQVYDDIPHVHTKGPTLPPQPHPYKARHPHEDWCIDGRQMDFALDGVTWWSLRVLEGYSRTILAGAMAPTEATRAALMVLYTACVRYGAPTALVSDSGGA